MNQFDDIRPYQDAEVADVLARLIADTEFIDLLLSRRVPLLPALLRPLARPLLRRSLQKLTADVASVADLQSHMASSLKALLDNTTDGYSFGGLEQLDSNRAHLFISNHRDIALDPAMVNLALHSIGLDSVRIAIGDNLLSKPFASDLMRVNRSFIVKRSATGRREKLAALKQLSAYIRHSIQQDNVSCWIAQAEGRAKDGNDRTETALLKMLALSKSSEQTFASAIAELRLIPVALSYEYDPCIVEKAGELLAAAQGRDYIKSEYEDLDSIQKGFVGYKGRIQVNFGEPIDANFSDADDLAAQIDRQINGLYQLFPSHIIAWQMQGQRDGFEIEQLQQNWPEENWAEAEIQFNQYIDALPRELREIIIGIYSAPVVNHLKYNQQQQF